MATLVGGTIMGKGVTLRKATYCLSWQGTAVWGVDLLDTQNHFSVLISQMHSPA